MKQIQWDIKHTTPSGGFAHVYIQSSLLQIYSSLIKNSVVVSWSWSLSSDDQQTSSGECGTFKEAEQALIAAWDAHMAALIAETNKVIVEVQE